MGNQSVGAGMRRRLTAKAVEALREGKLFGTLSGLPGSLMVRAKGETKVFYFRYRNTVDGDRAILLGRYDTRGKPHGLRLADATQEATRLAAQLKSTPDLSRHRELEERRAVEKRRDELRERKAAADKTLGRLCDVYAQHLQTQGKLAHKDVRNIFKLHLPQALRATPAAEVHPVDITAAVRRLIEAGKARTAGKLRSYVSAAFALALKAEADPTAPADALGFKVTSNPASAVRAVSGVRARDRVLSVEELRFLMRRATALPAATADALALLVLLGGQRPAQLLRATREDVQRDRIVLRDPKGRRQIARVHVLPLSEAAAAIVDRRLRIADELGAAYLFTSTGKAPLRLETLSEYIKRVSDDFLSQGRPGRGRAEPARGFQLRDIRRTCETELAALGVSRDVRAQLMSHGLGGVQQQHYDRHDYFVEKRRALEAWEARLAEISEGRARASNVVALKSA
jgi:integrase